MGDNIKVVVKVRPLISREIEDNLSYQWKVENNTLYQIDQQYRNGAVFTFDKVYDKDTETSAVYDDIAKPIVEAAAAGFNGTIFAYGQTSSGKTYTMTGTEDSPGIIQLAVWNLFDIIKRIPDRDFLVRVSYVEIYNETIIDLLDITKKNIKIHETYQGVKVDATEKVTTSPEEVLDIMTEGTTNRQTGTTNMNIESSRSHSIFQITIVSREKGEEEVGSVNVSQLNLVDLAGSERAGQTGATGLRFKEGTHINKSLSALALVIKQLSEDPHKHANYRDSKLTRILQNSLGGNTKTSIICAVTPAAVEETISTLQFANRAKAIQNKPEVNAVVTNKAMIKSLTNQLSNLKTQLESKKNVEQDNLNLQRQISTLQKFILTGFQMGNNDIIGGAQKKLAQSRRKTISTLHPIQEDTSPCIPKFCTPILKYNPMLLGSTSQLVPIQEASSLKSLPEETPGHITPPLKKNTVKFSDEVVEIDSDEDSLTCSPYHVKCYDSSKTPPCILRKQTRQAKKELNDILELTEREKMFPPNEVELLNRLEEKSIALAQLEDKINELNKLCLGKDSEIATLKKKLEVVENDLRASDNVKMELERLCNENNVKLTDLEVSLETHKNKYKIREKELLSLLEEQTSKIKKTNSGIPNTLDICLKASASDILVNESLSTCSENDMASKHIQEMVSELQKEITLKDETINELRAYIDAKNRKLEIIENVNTEFKEILTSCKENLLIAQNENTIYMTKIKELNLIIESQKTEIDSISKDAESYNNEIKELQCKLFEVPHKSYIDDVDIERMISNEEIFISNNVNMKTIIHSLKSALDSKIEELKILKSNLNTQTSDISCETNDLILEKELQCLREQVKDQITIINKLKQENANFRSIEEEFICKLRHLENKISNLDKINNEAMAENHNLKEDISKLNSEVSSKEIEFKLNECHLKTKIEELSNKVVQLEEDIIFKDEKISNIYKEDSKTEENIKTAKIGLHKLQNIISLLTDNIQEIPNVVDDFVVTLNMFVEKLTILENAIKTSVDEKVNLQNLIENYEKDFITIREEVQKTDDLINNFLDEYVEYLIKSDIFSSEQRPRLEPRDVYFRFYLDKIRCFIAVVRNAISNLLGNIEDRDKKIIELNQVIDDRSIENSNNAVEIIKQKEAIQKISVQREQELHRILEKLFKLLDREIEYNIAENICDKIDLLTDDIAQNIESIHCKFNTDLNGLSEQNTQLRKNISHLQIENNNLKNHKERLMVDLKESNDILKMLEEDVKSKTNDIQVMERKMLKLKDKFCTSESDRHIDNLKLDNVSLVSQLLGNTEKSKPTSYLNEPLSLHTICCKNIIESLYSCHNDYDSITSTSSNARFIDSEVQTCNDNIHISHLQNLQDENKNLKKIINKLSIENHSFVVERDENLSEIQILLESCEELKKKVINHRTILSTLTATTYAENKLLSSQLKCVQHFHNRFYNACQKDIPGVKKQLQVLMEILKREYSVIMTKENLEKNDILSNALEISESTFDGDLLMLDTNVTLASLDNTVTNQDQTSDTLHMCTYSEKASQTSNFNANYAELSNGDLNYKIIDTLHTLRTENNKLRLMVEEYKQKKECMGHSLCENCYRLEDLLSKNSKEKEQLLLDITSLMEQKSEIETKYNTLLLEMPSTDALVKKMNQLEKEYNKKQFETEKLTTSINEKMEQFKVLQEENESLSNQLIENVEEVDELRIEISNLQTKNKELQQLAKENSSNSICPQCISKDDMINSLHLKLVSSSEPHNRLSRSYSDSEKSLRHTKICTLQNELHAGKEDCDELTKEVINIRNHLEQNSLPLNESMDLDHSMGDISLIQSIKRDPDIETEQNKLIINDQTSDMYALDKMDCLNFYHEKTQKECSEVRILEIMKLLYTDLMAKQSDAVENLLNNLRDIEESKLMLEKKLNSQIDSHLKLSNEMKEKDMYFQTLAQFTATVNNNIKTANSIIKDVEIDVATKEVRDKVFNIMDKEIGINSVEIFENLICLLKNNHLTKINDILEEKYNLENQLKLMSDEIKLSNDQCMSLKTQLMERESNYNLLLAQKGKIEEISNAVTLNLTKNEEELKSTLSYINLKLVERHMINPEDFNMELNSCKNITKIFNHILEENDKKQNLDIEKNDAVVELNNTKALLHEKERELKRINEEHEKLKDTFIKEKEEIQKHSQAHQSLLNVYEKKVEENTTNISIIAKITEEVHILKEIIINKERCIEEITKQMHNKKDESDAEIVLMMKTIQNYTDEMEKLKQANEIILKEKEIMSNDLQRANEIIQQNKRELEKMTCDMQIMKESMKENSEVVEKLKQETGFLCDQNDKLKTELQEKCNECMQLERNIKTHQKTVEIQSNMIIRHHKQKETDDKCINELNNKLDQLQQRCTSLLQECDHLKTENKNQKEEIGRLLGVNQQLETRISELESEVASKAALECNGDVSRRRRQSLYDSMKCLEDNEDHKMDMDTSGRNKCEDVFMDADDSSSRSTSVQLCRGRDSLASKHDQSEEDGQSRSGSVLAIRRRRQSTHDLHRSVSALDTSRKRSEDRNASSNSDIDSEVSKLRQRLGEVQGELSELQERYRELDEECETCAEYLRDREAQCVALKKDKLVLEQTIADLRLKMQNPACMRANVNVANASVNTDEDWANLHSVVVDRMSFDAEVEKNKKLTKTVEELRYQKQELKNTMGKMQRAIERNVQKDKDLEAMRSELESCKLELSDVRKRCKELDEECETCAEYLREREEQCRRLKEAKAALECKLAEYQESSEVFKSVRKRRQSTHDRARLPHDDVSAAQPDTVDFATQTTDDLLSYQVERDESTRKFDEVQAAELKRLRVTVEHVSHQKAALEHQLRVLAAAPPLAAPPTAPLYVSTGSAIVQNKQIGDVMKENQKLKRMNAKLVSMCKKRGKDTMEHERENVDPTNQIN
ncbi:kinesin-related protein 4-like isoform X2 [Leptidea sinapis]|uniref:kinesin-related protein 4-like isoform X2 n=1 Tax=Leptidea sinapis TaxID=189913 RepID=UPI0021C3AA47|nr:kinesin-related protein 4-like isoform X2 [Leptidea sinapis]